MAAENRKNVISFFNANFTLVMSVALVLLTFGVVAFTGIAGASLKRMVKEQVGFDIVLRDSVPVKELNALKQQLNRANYVNSVKYISKEDALQDWKVQNNEDLVALLGFNPLSSEFNVRLKEEYSSMDSIDVIISDLKKLPAVDSVVVQDDMVTALNSNLNAATYILLAIAVVLTLISIALINNSVRLLVYSKRFLIYTMKLVGASASFIRRPFVVQNLVNGILAGIIADACLAGILYYINNMVDSQISILIPFEISIVVYIGIIIAGMMLCTIAAFFAANKYVRLDYDALFRR